MTHDRLRGFLLSALFGTLMTLFALINVPLPFTSIAMTMAMMGVFLCGGLLAPRYAVLSQLVYIGLGVLGLPVFSRGQSGIGTLAGPTGGYIIAYPLMALVIALMMSRLRWSVMVKLPAALLISIALCYTLGTLWFSFTQRIPVISALSTTALPFLPFDLIKAAACTAVLPALRRRLAFSQKAG